MYLNQIEINNFTVLNGIFKKSRNRIFEPPIGVKFFYTEGQSFGIPHKYIEQGLLNFVSNTESINYLLGFEYLNGERICKIAIPIPSWKRIR